VADLHFSGLVVVAGVAFAAPLLLGLAPQLRLPAAVLELVAGIAIGPHGLGWVDVDAPIQVVSLLGLAFLLFLAGLELELRELRGPPLRLALTGFAATIVIAVVAGLVLDVAGAAESALLVGIALMATSLGLVVPVLKDAGESATAFGQLVIAASSVADVGAIVLLTLFFSRESSGVGTKLVLLGAFVALVELQARSPWLVLAAMAIVWIADTAAYFSGRAFGRRKLAPSISPGKTWEGAIGGTAGAAAPGYYAPPPAYVAAPPAERTVIVRRRGRVIEPTGSIGCRTITTRRRNAMGDLVVRKIRRCG
jgi:Kef-type K+ transport system membrane component KefB